MKKSANNHVYRSKKRIAYFLIPILLFFILPAQAEAAWYNSSWAYRKSHTINAATGAGTNYQMKITAHYGSGSDSVGDVYLDSHSRTDFADVMFTASDETTPLDYWIESKTDSDNAVFWVEVAADLSTVNQNIYIYYGNAGQSTSGSNGANTFLFFDDFSGASLDLDKWTTYNVDSTSQSGGILTAATTNKDPNKIIADVNGTGQTGDNVAMRARYRITGGSGADQRIGLSIKTTVADGQGLNYLLHDFASKNKHQFLDDALAWGTDNGGTFLANTWYTEEIYYNGTDVVGRFDDGTWYSWTRGGRAGYMALNTGGYLEAVSNEWDFALIRKIVATEPANSTWGSEEPAPVVSSVSTKIAVSPTKSLTLGLVGYWTFDGKNTNWATGKTTDSAGTNTGQLISMSTSTSPVVGKIGQGLKFDGVNDYITGTGYENSTYTMSAWIKVSGTVSTWAGIVAYTDSSGNRREIGLNATGKPIVVYGSQKYKTSSGSDLDDNKWHHVIGTYDGSTAQLYIDGISVSLGTETSGGSAAGNNLLWIGRLIPSTANNYRFNGLIDEVRIYNRALSASEITQLYKLGAAKVAVSPTKSLTSGLVANWTFDGPNTNWATGKTNDVIGGNNGQLISMSTTTSPTVGKIGQALKLDGVDDQITINDTNNSLDGVGAETLSLWFYPTVNNSSWRIIAGKGTSAANYGLWYQSSAFVAVISSGGWKNHYSVASFPPNAWYHVVGVFDSNNDTIRVYVNGVDRTLTAPAETANMVADDNPFYISPLFSGNLPVGKIDDVRVYNRALSATEITQLYKLGSTKSR